MWPVVQKHRPSRSWLNTSRLQSMLVLDLRAPVKKFNIRALAESTFVKCHSVPQGSEFNTISLSIHECEFESNWCTVIILLIIMSIHPSLPPFIPPPIPPSIILSVCHTLLQYSIIEPGGFICHHDPECSSMSGWYGSSDVVVVIREVLCYYAVLRTSCFYGDITEVMVL